MKAPRTPGLVSVIIPVHNGERYLAAALDSVLTQDFDPIEVIVVDDGSTDGSPRVIGSFGDLLCVRQGNLGPAAARNAGLRVAHGEFISFLDADDVMTPDKVSAQVRYLRDNPDADCVLGLQHVVVDEEIPPPRWVLDISPLSNVGSDPFAAIALGQAQPLSLIARAEIFERVGGFRPELRLSEDIDLLFRIEEAGFSIGLLPHVVMERRVHGANLTYAGDQVATMTFRLLRDRMNRKRQRGASRG